MQYIFAIYIPNSSFSHSHSIKLSYSSYHPTDYVLHLEIPISKWFFLYWRGWSFTGLYELAFSYFCILKCGYCYQNVILTYISVMASPNFSCYLFLCFLKLSFMNQISCFFYYFVLSVLWSSNKHSSHKICMHDYLRHTMFIHSDFSQSQSLLNSISGMWEIWNILIATRTHLHFLSSLASNILTLSVVLN